MPDVTHGDLPADRSPDAGMSAARTSPHSRGSQIARAAWGLVQATLFRLSPRPMHRWRNWLLRRFGADLHRTARVYPGARVWAPWNLTMARYSTIADHVEVYDVAPIAIGAATTISQFSHLCAATHDFEDVAFPLVSRPITIGARCWLAAETFVGPGVTIADGVVVGARSTVLHDLPAWTVCVGTPARPRRARSLREPPAAAGPAEPASTTHASPRGATERRSRLPSSP